MLSKVREMNPGLQILSLREAPQHPLFRRIDVDARDLLAAAESIAPGEENCYIAQDEKMRGSACARSVWREVFAEMPIQTGWCFGGQCCLNGMEWHKSSEVNVACTDLLLLLGSYDDIQDDFYASERAIGLYMHKGETVELLPMTLHFAPLPTEKAGRFIAAVILPTGTNMPLENGVDGTLRAQNKWLLVHPEYERGIRTGGKIGISGENFRLRLD